MFSVTRLKVVCDDYHVRKGAAEMRSGVGWNGYLVPGTREKVPVPSCTGDRGGRVSKGSIQPGSGAFPVVLPPGDTEAAMSRAVGSSSSRSSRLMVVGISGVRVG